MLASNYQDIGRDLRLYLEPAARGSGAGKAGGGYGNADGSPSNNGPGCGETASR